MASLPTVEVAAPVVPGCQLCASAPDPASHLVVQLPKFRVIRALDAPSFPAFYRVIWRAHVPEWTDLSPTDRALCLEAVARVEQVLRSVLAPHKINLASLGNVVPHLHWHVVARFDWDTHFPQPIWGAAQRAADDARLSTVRERLMTADQDVARAVMELAGC